MGARAWRVIETRRNPLQSVSESVQKVDLRWGATGIDPMTKHPSSHPGRHMGHDPHSCVIVFKVSLGPVHPISGLHPLGSV